MDIKQKKEELESLLEIKMKEFQELEAKRSKIAEEVISVRGKLDLIKELDKEDGGKQQGSTS